MLVAAAPVSQPITGQGTSFGELAGWVTCGIVSAVLLALLYRARTKHGVCLEQLAAQRRHIEEASREHLREQVRYRTLIDATSAVSWATDAQGRIVEAQQSWERFTGQSWPSYQAEGWLESVHPSDRPTVQAEWRNCLAGGTVCNVIGRLWHGPSNRYRHVTARAIPIREANVVREWLCAIIDADDETRAAESMRAAQAAAEVANRAKGEFLANVSHELRTPMYAIVGMTELALDEELSAPARDYLETAKGSAEILLNLVNEILDFSKLESGKFELESGPFRLRPLLDETIKALGIPAAEKGLELICEVAPDVPETVLGDPLRLRQVLTNLLNNAVKFSNQGEVGLRAMVESRSSDAVSLRFEVSDTGIGISQADQDRIFAPFTQVDSSSTRQHGGTGLGLAIADDLVRLMGGRIGVTSTLGRGSNFYFRVTLPEAPSGGELAGKGTAHSDLAGMRVLVVDDNSTNRRILETTLRQGHAEPVVVADGQTCLEKLRQGLAKNEPFQLVIVDALMPGMDGFMLVEQIKADPRLAEAVILMLSSADRHTFRERCEQLGIDKYLEKPISQAALWDAIAAATGRARRAAPRSAAAPELRPSQALRVLLAEDTPANQKIVKNILTKRGHEVEIARNGREVVEMIRYQPYDIILMDVQMPIMDGFQATTAIRSLEAHQGQHVPIVALTAHAMQGDRERCLAAGMDAYLVKPVSTANLIELVENFTSGRKEPPHTVPPKSHSQPMAAERKPEPSSSDTPRRAFDLEAALSRLGNDWSFFAKLIEFFLEDYPTLLAQIRTAVQEQNAGAVAHAAHSLKGLVANFDAHATVRVAARIEKAGFDKDLATAAASLESLEHELLCLCDALLPYRGTEGPQG